MIPVEYENDVFMQDKIGQFSRVDLMAMIEPSGGGDGSMFGIGRESQLVSSRTVLS